jgi:hypothetical protein
MEACVEQGASAGDHRNGQVVLALEMLNEIL